MRGARAGMLEIVVCTLSWGAIGTIVRHLDVGAPTIVFFRLLFGVLVVGVYVAARGHLGSLRPRRRPVLLVSSGLTLGIHWLLLFEAYQRIGVVTTILIVFVGPVLWALAAPLVLDERFRASTFGATIVAFAGLALISLPGIGGLDLLGLMSALGSAVLFAVLVLQGKLLTGLYEPPVIVVWQLGVAAVLVSPALASASGEQVARALPGLLVLGCVMSGALGILFFRAMRALEAQQLGVLFYLEPASAVLYAWLFAGEEPTATTLLGGALVVAAGLAIILLDRRAAPAALSEPVAPTEA